jgi:hypothetical protein
MIQAPRHETQPPSFPPEGPAHQIWKCPPRLAWGGTVTVTQWLILASFAGALSGKPLPEAGADTYIRQLIPEERLEFIIRYAASGWNYSGFIKFPQPPRIFVHCQDAGCDPGLLNLLADLQSRVPGAYAGQVTEPDVAQIEIYIAAKPAAFDQRDHQVDDTLHVSAQVGSRFLVPPQPAPCRATIYFDRRRWTIAKTMIFIDSDASPRMQHVCMGFELVRAIGAINMPLPLLYREHETQPGYDPSPYLAANAFLHTSAEIRPGDPMEKALTIFKDRYGVQ